MITAFLLSAALFASCGPAESSGPSGGGRPVANVEILSPGSNSVTVSVKLIRAEVAWLLALPEDEPAPKAAELKSSGTPFKGGEGELGGLKQASSYILYYCPEASGGTLGSVSSVPFRTISAEPYSWESSRDGIPFFADLALIYGGSPRNPKFWTPERLRSHVSWKDPDTGEEKWLFDAFLALDFRTADNSDPHSFVIGSKDWYDNSLAMKTANREDASAWLDYWFRDNNGFVALDKVVGEAAARIGDPPVAPKVIVMMPDITAHERYNLMSSSTTYWGTVGGKVLDFSNPADRVAAYCWFVDEVRERFSRAYFQHIELGGFYIMSEELASMRSGVGGHGGDTVDGQLRDGWEVAAKAWDDIFPAVADYIHLFNEALVWIPYRSAAGYRYWKDFGIDYAYMQPNRFWDTNNVNPMASFFNQISTYRLNMELEFDDRLMKNPVDASDSSYKEGEDYNTYRGRWREYIDGMQNAEVYGHKQLAVYMGGNSLCNLSQSTEEGDRAIFNEFCRLIAEDPLKENNR